MLSGRLCWYEARVAAAFRAACRDGRERGVGEADRFLSDMILIALVYRVVIAVPELLIV